MRASVVVLALCMLFTGTINTIATKYQDIIVIGTAPDGTPLTFRHPAVQSACMFLGESLCLIPYFYMRWRRRKAKRLDPAYVPMPAEEKRSRRIGRILAFAVPTLCDATGTSLMNIGLFYTYASTYQMLRGTLVLFAGAFTILILRRQLFIHHWLGMVLITAGAALVGASSVIYQDGPASSNANTWQQQQQWQQMGAHSSSWSGVVGAAAAGQLGWNETLSQGLLHYAPGVSRVASRGMLSLRSLSGMDSSSTSSSIIGSATQGTLQRSGWFGGLRLWSGAANDGPDVAAAPLFGDLLVVGAQMFTALQFILEEKFLVKYKVPALLAVGLEGCWGLVLCSFILPITSIVKGPDGVPLDDAVSAVKAIIGNAELGGAVYLSIFSIAFFNFFGVSVTKSLSGAARATIDACRTVFIWLYALHAGWESFHALEVVGFIVLISGTSLYNEIIKSCLPGTSIIPDHTRHSQPPRSRRRTRASGQGQGRPSGSGAPGSTAQGAATPDGLTTPLLTAAEGDADAAAAPAAPGSAGGAAEAGGSSGGPSRVGWRAPPVPLQRPGPAHQRVYDAEQSTGTSGSWVYHMARSMRLGIHTLSPQSLAATGGGLSGLGQDDVETGSESDAASSYYSNYLGSSLDYGSSLGRSTSAGQALPSQGMAQGEGPRGGSGVTVLRGFAAPGASQEGSPGVTPSPGTSVLRQPGAGTSGTVGGLSASLQAAAAAAAATQRAGSPAAGSGVPPLPRASSSSSMRRQSSSSNMQQQQQQQQPPGH